jgi:multisubunit Na+/H+ antiporter MnhB subunit
MLTFLFIIVTTIVVLLAFEKERQRRAKHRAKTRALLGRVTILPLLATIEAACAPARSQ